MPFYHIDTSFGSYKFAKHIHNINSICSLKDDVWIKHSCSMDSV